MTEPATFQLEVDRHHAILTLLPGLNRIPWADIESVGAKVVASVQELQSPKVLVDLTPLDYMGSAQVALIVRVFKTVKQKQGTLAVCCQHPVVQEVLTLAGLNKIWAIVRTREEGLDRLGIRLAGQAPPAHSAWPTWSGLVLAVVAAILLTIGVLNVTGLPAGTLIGLSLALAAVAFGLGLSVVLNAAGIQRSLGVATLVAGVGLLLGGVYSLAAKAATSTPVAEVPLPPDPPPSPAMPAPASVKPGSSPATATVKPGRE